MMNQNFCNLNPDERFLTHKKIKKLNINSVKLAQEECERCALEAKNLKEVHGLDKTNFNIRNDENKTCKKQTIYDCASCKEFENHSK